MISKKYDDEFRKQIVDLVKSKIKTVNEVVGEYGVSDVTIYSWIKKHNKSSSFRAEDQLTDSQKELKELKRSLNKLKKKMKF